MFNHNSFSATSFNAVSWRFDTREQTITYARVAAHVRAGQEVVFAYSQESLRVATKVSYPVAFVSGKQSSAFVKEQARVKKSVPKQTQHSRRKTSATPNTAKPVERVFVTDKQATSMAASFDQVAHIVQPAVPVAFATLPSVSVTVN